MEKRTAILYDPNGKRVYLDPNYNPTATPKKNGHKVTRDGGHTNRLTSDMRARVKCATGLAAIVVHEFDNDSHEPMPKPNIKKRKGMTVPPTKNGMTAFAKSLVQGSMFDRE